MPPLRSTLNAQGRTTVPAEIRRKLGIGPGSIVEWVGDGDHVIVRKFGKYSFDDIRRALFPIPPKPRTLEEMKEGIADYVRDKHGRR
jgi:AbrB family looped-hinge helix DNA binding protein